MQSQCNFAIKSQQKCAGTFPFQTLDDLENATRKIPGKHMKISWLILSRVGVHYLSANFNGWTICPVHKKEFLGESYFWLLRIQDLYMILVTVLAPIKDAASIQKSFFEPTHYDAFYPKLFTLLQ